MVFKSKTDNGDAVKKPENRGSRAPLVITIAVLAIVGSAYYAYYRKQAEYYTGRNLRLLAMLTAQVEGRVDMLAGFVRENNKNAGIDLETCAGESNDAAAMTDRSREVLRSIQETGHGLMLALRAIPATNAAQTPNRQTQKTGAAPEKTGERASVWTCATIALDKLFQPIFGRRVGGAFDVILVARADGRVLYSMRPRPNTSTLLGQEEEWIDEEEEVPSPDEPAKETKNNNSEAVKGAMSDRESGSTILLANLDVLQQKTGWNAYEALKPVTLTKATGHVNVALGGADYVLFTQPYTFDRAVVTTGKQSKQGEQWIVCGLVSASRFRYDVSAVSISTVLVAIALALLALCCWPFLRIALIDPSQPLTITDVVLISICTLAGSAVITLALLDAFAYQSISHTAGDQLEQFSRRVNNDFGDNVSRAMEVLETAERETSAEAHRLAGADKAAGATTTTRTQLLPQTLMTSEEAGLYPYIDSIAWIDDDGMQQVRFGRTLSPLADVSARPYFKLARLERTWPIEGHKYGGHQDKGHKYVLEWVRSKATGEVRAVLAKKTIEAKKWDKTSAAEREKIDPPFAVIAMATELIDVSHAIRPPGVEMAIIDENGEVIYHTDTQRIGYENFFAETDHNRELRAAVVARRAGAVNAAYWGEDQSMYAMPLRGSRWTLVTFSAKRLPRVLNVEAALLTLMMLLISSTPYALLFISALLVSPRYRAPRLWPDETRHGDYLRLSIILLGMIGLFCLNNLVLAPWSSFRGIVIIPALSLTTAYLVLHRSGAPRRFAIGTAVWIVAMAVLITHMILGDIQSDYFFSDYPVFAKAFLVIAALAVGWLTHLLISGWKRCPRICGALYRLGSHYGYSTLYRSCGVLLLTIGVAMPVIGFFNISRHVQSELMVKYGQLRIAADLEHRIDHLATLNAMPSSATPTAKSMFYRDIFSNPLRRYFGGRWTLFPPVTNAAPWPRSDVQPEFPRNGQEKNWTIPSWAETWLPALYEDSIAIQPLFKEGSADDLWHWRVDGRLIKLVRKIQFDVDVDDVVWAKLKPEGSTETLVIESHLPQASFWMSSVGFARDAGGNKSQAPLWLHFGTMLLIAVPLLVIFWYAVDFVSKRVLLIDIHEPDWLARKPLSPTLGEHIFLVRRDRDMETLTKGLAFVDVSFEMLDQYDNWTPALETLDSSESSRNVRIVDFEYGINDGVINEKKLQWLERLLLLTDRTVITVSAVSPSYLMTTSPPPAMPAEETAAYFEQWRTLFKCFVTVTAEELDLRHEEWERRKEFHNASQLHAAGPKSWLEKETAHNAFLRRLYGELVAEANLCAGRRDRDPNTYRRRLLDEIGERAETYFAGLWLSCREDEKLLLYNLAHNGLANGRGRRILRRLIARGLVRRDPNLELFSESFRLYVLEAAQRENIVNLARENRGASAWDSLRVPFFVIIISFVLLVFATQKDIMTTTTALATALTTGLPILMKLIGVFTDRRAETKS
jgi:hypothetical protein